MLVCTCCGSDHTNFFMEFVMRRWTSCRSSSNNMAPRYPILLSENLEDAINFIHSIYEKTISDNCIELFLCFNYHNILNTMGACVGV